MPNVRVEAMLSVTPRDSFDEHSVDTVSAVAKTGYIV